MTSTTLKAFVSSTYEDLKEHRAYVISQLRHCGIHVDPMEYWDAAPDSPKTFSTVRIEGCDLFVLLIGTRRGHVPEGETRSITQLEYDYARRLGVDILPFILTKASAREDEDRSDIVDESDQNSDFQEWRRYIREHHGVGFFSRPAESVPVVTSVARWLISRQLPVPSSLSLRGVLDSRHADVRGFFAGRLDLVKLAFDTQFGGQHVVPDFSIGPMTFDYAIVRPVGVMANAPPSIVYISLKDPHDLLLGGAIGETMDAIDRFLDDPERGQFEPCSDTRGMLIQKTLTSREDYRELAYDWFSECAVLAGGTRNTLSKKELEIMRRRNAIPGRLRVITWDTVAEHLDGLVAAVRSIK